MGEGRRCGEEHKWASGSLEIWRCATPFTMWAIHRTWKEEESMAWENAEQEEVDEFMEEFVRRMENEFFLIPGVWELTLPVASEVSWCSQLTAWQMAGITSVIRILGAVALAVAGC